MTATTKISSMLRLKPPPFRSFRYGENRNDRNDRNDRNRAKEIRYAIGQQMRALNALFARY